MEKYPNNYDEHQQHNDYIQSQRDSTEGKRIARTSLILGIVSIFFVGIIIGPIAIIMANKAESYKVPATGGKVTGWIGSIVSLAVIVFYGVMLP